MNKFWAILILVGLTSGCKYHVKKNTYEKEVLGHYWQILSVKDSVGIVSKVPSNFELFLKSRHKNRFYGKLDLYRVDLKHKSNKSCLECSYRPIFRNEFCIHNVWWGFGTYMIKGRKIGVSCAEDAYGQYESSGWFRGMHDFEPVLYKSLRNRGFYEVRNDTLYLMMEDHSLVKLLKYKLE